MKTQAQFDAEYQAQFWIEKAENERHNVAHEAQYGVNPTPPDNVHTQTYGQTRGLSPGDASRVSLGLPVQRAAVVDPALTAIKAKKAYADAMRKKAEYDQLKAEMQEAVDDAWRRVDAIRSGVQQAQTQKAAVKSEQATPAGMQVHAHRGGFVQTPGTSQPDTQYAPPLRDVVRRSVGIID